MFVNLIQRGALRTGNSEILKRLADKILEKHGEPIIVKNLENYSRFLFHKLLQLLQHHHKVQVQREHRLYPVRL